MSFCINRIALGLQTNYDIHICERSSAVSKCERSSAVSNCERSSAEFKLVFVQNCERSSAVSNCERPSAVSNCELFLDLSVF